MEEQFEKLKTNFPLAWKELEESSWYDNALKSWASNTEQEWQNVYDGFEQRELSLSIPEEERVTGY